MASKVKQNYVYFIIIFFTLFILSHQPIICSGLYIDDISRDDVCQGYTLISPRKERHVFLIDMEGNIIHEYSISGFPAKMLTNGTIIGSRVVNEKYENFGREGTVYKYVSKEDWDGKIIWEFCNWINGWAIQHHDIYIEGNPVYYSPIQKTIIDGNLLILSREDWIKNKSISWLPLQEDMIYEVDDSGNLTDFRWYPNDYFDEIGFDLISKIGIYLIPGGQGWLHINSCSELGENKWYNQGYEEFNPNNLLVNSRHANFMVIVNRTTGEIVWKVGPNYNNGDDKKLGQLIGCHDPNMIPKGLPGEGNILVFDNGGFAGYGLLGGLLNFPLREHRFYSRVVEFNPITKEIVWEYSSRVISKNRFFSIYQGSAQRLPNGNTLIDEGTTGRVFEVTPEKKIVWEYKYEGEGKTIRDDWIYRAYRVPPEWVPENPSNYPSWESLYEV